MDRYWLLTWTTYGTWLPGAEPGYVGSSPDETGRLILHNIPGTPYLEDQPALRDYARSIMNGPPVFLITEHAVAIRPQFQETAECRGWELLAVAVMANHVHIVVGVPGDPAPEKLLHSFKAYASRVLNARWGKRPNGTWWTESGSKRILRDDDAVPNALRYVRDQDRPLVTWLHPNATAILGERGQ